MSEQYILVIKHGSLGDFIMVTPAFRAIRQHHPQAHIVLMTAQPYASLAQQMPYFDQVWVDNREKWYKLSALFRVWRKLNGGGLTKRFDRIYDIQGSSRTAFYFKLLAAPKPEWVGAVRGCSHPRPFPPDLYHPREIHQRHLATAGLCVEQMPDINWMQAEVSALKLPPRFVCLMPSCSAKHAVKRWSAAGFAELIDWLGSQGIPCVLLGTKEDKSVIDAIKCKVSNMNDGMDLCGKTTLAMIAEIARRSVAVIGNDTGPMHIAAATGTKTVVLFSKQSKSAHLCAPSGEQVHILEHQDLTQLPFTVVQAYCKKHLGFSA
jgi:ADP-heptose:LPS heptosyltransferase